MVVFIRLAGGDTNDTDDELSDNHTHGTEDEDRAATESLNHPE